jgi:chromosome segregation ATPase
LMQLLKEKAKELKQTQKKLKKVEDKFVEIHKAQKNIIDDREVLLQFLQLVFPPKILEEEIMIMPEG